MLFMISRLFYVFGIGIITFWDQLLWTLPNDVGF